MYCILGQGLAGTTLALTLHNRNVPFKIIDDGHLSSSSMVAAGMWNPIVFRRVNKSWMTDAFIPELESFYPECERLLEARFYHSKPIWRIHTSKQERDHWFEKKSLQGFKPFLFNQGEKFSAYFGRESEYGEGEVRHAGYLDLPSYLAASRKFFEQSEFLIKASVEDDFDPDNPHLNGMDPEAIIDARGYRSGMSGFWDYLPWGLTKGEVLTLRSEGLPTERIFNSGFFLLPLGQGLFKLGATFNWDALDEEPTRAAREQLLAKFEKFFDRPYEVVDHRAGVRPTVQDRRPLLGKHPLSERLFLFNGLGTKGVMSAPFLADHFAEYLLRGEPLMKDVDISRFEKHLGEKNPQINHPSG